ncbi:MAG: hypothetical protein GF317_09195 [Candidatus Lokiarchaeota archaeon]|nr:hypothetical protein [Candidatus Lokiarchaeota archaeon]MBD3199886.1 hypothetical protein [Candidatus Lokiarchaeota archaeon]
MGSEKLKVWRKSSRSLGKNKISITHFINILSDVHYAATAMSTSSTTPTFRTGTASAATHSSKQNIGRWAIRRYIPKLHWIIYSSLNISYFRGLRIPIILLGHLGVDNFYKHKQLGIALIKIVLEKSLEAIN